MELRVQFAAGVMLVNGEHHIIGGSVVIGGALPDPSSRVRFEFAQGRRDCLGMGHSQSIIATQHGHNRDRLRRGESKVVKVSGSTARFAVRPATIGAVPCPQKFPRHRVEPLP
jgi:hypothetical protein